MANTISCEACEEIRQNDPSFVVNGLGDTECASLQNDTGLVASSGNNDCEDLNNLNDCLVGNMATEVEAYDVCDWKTFMKRFIPNLWTTLKAIICAICGIWTNIHNLWARLQELLEKINCVYGGLEDLADAIAGTIGSQSFVRYYRDNSGQQGSQYYWNVVKDASHTLDIYMDANVDNPGTRPADKDYVVMISNCTDMESPEYVVLDVTYYSSGDTDSLTNIRLRRAQHPTWAGPDISEFSWTTSGAVLIKKGEHVKVNAYVVDTDSSDSARFRLHQFVLTWIPVNASGSFDPSSVLPTCE